MIWNRTGENETELNPRIKRRKKKTIKPASKQTKDKFSRAIDAWNFIKIEVTAQICVYLSVVRAREMPHCRFCLLLLVAVILVVYIKINFGMDACQCECVRVYIIYIYIFYMLYIQYWLVDTIFVLDYNMIHTRKFLRGHLKWSEHERENVCESERKKMYNKCFWIVL